jgi:hypothetical protein
MPPPPPPPDPLLEDGEDWGDDNDDALLVAASQEKPTCSLFPFFQQPEHLRHKISISLFYRENPTSY